MSTPTSPFQRARWFYVYVAFALCLALASFLWEPFDSPQIRTGTRLIPLLLIWAADSIEAGRAGLSTYQRKAIKRALLPPRAGLYFLVAGALVVMVGVSHWPWQPAALAIVAAGFATVAEGSRYDETIGRRYDWKVPQPPSTAPPA